MKLRCGCVHLNAMGPVGQAWSCLGIAVEENPHQVRTGNHAEHLALVVTDDDAFDAVTFHHLDNIMQILLGVYADHLLHHMLGDRRIRGLQFAMMCQVTEQGFQGLP